RRCGTAAHLGVGCRSMLEIQRVAVFLEAGTAGDVAASVAAIAGSEIARGATFVQARRPFTRPLQNASGHGVFSLRFKESTRTDNPRHSMFDYAHWRASAAL